MQIKNQSGTVYSSHVINAQIVAVKLPNLGKGKSWKTKASKLNGEAITLNYNEARPTGVYFEFGGGVNYVRERAILEDKSLTVVVKEPKPKAEKPAKEAKGAEAKGDKAKGGKAKAGKKASKAQPDTGAA